MEIGGMAGRQGQRREAAQAALETLITKSNGDFESGEEGRKECGRCG
jgi:hypothetical protein